MSGKSRDVVVAEEAVGYEGPDIGNIASRSPTELLELEEEGVTPLAAPHPRVSGLGISISHTAENDFRLLGQEEFIESPYRFGEVETNSESPLPRNEVRDIPKLPVEAWVNVVE